MTEKGKKFYGDMQHIEDHIKSLRDSKFPEEDIIQIVGADVYAIIYKDEKKPKLSLEEEAKISAEGALHDPLYFNNELSVTPSGIRYDRDLTLQLIRHMRASEATDQEIAAAIGTELFELLGKKKEKKKEKESGTKKSKFSWFRK